MATTIGQYEVELKATEAGPIGIRDLKQNASAIIRRVRENREAFTITHRGKVVARVVPVEDPEESRARTEEILAEMDELAKRIGEGWPPGVSAAEAVKEQRREL